MRTRNAMSLRRAVNWGVWPLAWGVLLGLCACARLTIGDVGHLRQGMTMAESRQVTGMAPTKTAVLDSAKGIEVHSYIISSGDYHSTYFLAFEKNSLLYWGYPHEFARSTDPHLNEIGRRAVRKLH